MALTIVFTVVQRLAAHRGRITLLSNAAVTITNTGDAFTHRSAEGTWLTLVREARLKGALTGDRIWRGAFTGNGATHCRSFIASKIFHAAAVVGGVTGGRWEAQVGGWFADKQFAVGPWRTFLTISASSHEICSNNTTCGEGVASLSKATIRIDLTRSVVGVIIGSWCSRPIAMGIELGAIARGTQGFTATLYAGFMTVAFIGRHTLDADTVVAIGLRSIKAGAVIFTASTVGGSHARAAR